MIVTLTSLKGGAGKTTLSGLWALNLAQRCQREVLLLDLDPQAGATSLFLGGKPEGPRLYDLLQSHLADDLPPGALQSAVRPALAHPHIFLLPADARLQRLPEEQLPLETLADLLREADLPPETITLIDTGPQRFLVGLGMAAAEAVAIPLMLSPQSIKPTVNTLALLQSLQVPLLGLVPLAVGSAQWEAELLAGWDRTLQTRFEQMQYVDPEARILPPLPSARTLVRGNWVANAFPDRFSPTFQALTVGLLAQAVPPSGTEVA